MKDIICECGKTLFQTDGEFVYSEGLKINPDEDTQTIICDSCSGKTLWKRDQSVIVSG